MSDVAPIESGKPGTLAFLANPKYAKYIYTTNASIVLIGKDFKPDKEIKTTLVQVEDAYKAFASLLDLYQSMINMVSAQGRPKDLIEAVLQLPFITQKPDAYTIGNNDGREAGRSIDHLHVILMPRYKGDVEDPRGGIRNIIPNRANYQRR